MKVIDDYLTHQFIIFDVYSSYLMITVIENEEVYIC